MNSPITHLIPCRDGVDDGSVAQLSAAVSRIDAAARHLQSQQFMALVAQEVQSAVRQALSPWADRRALADYLHTSVSEVDRAHAAGIIQSHPRNSAPLFEKSAVDAVIRAGKWRKLA